MTRSSELLLAWIGGVLACAGLGYLIYTRETRQGHVPIPPRWPIEEDV